MVSYTYRKYSVFIEETSNKKYDVVIVGAGPAGISIALRLAKQQNTRILLVESGELEFNPKINKLSEVEATGDLANAYYPIHAQRVLGGTSSVWAGYCAMLEERAFLNNEWPINFIDLKPYYKDAADILELPPEAFQVPSKKIVKEENIIYKPYYLSPPVRFNEKYRTTLQEHPNVDVIFNSTCTNILSNGNNVEAILIQDSSGNSLATKRVNTKYCVLACGGIGNARILQLSGVAPKSPVGKYFSEHPHIYNCGELELNTDRIKPFLSNEKVVHALQLSDKYCLKNKILSFTVSFTAEEMKEHVFLGKRTSAYSTSAIIRAEMESYASNHVALNDNHDHLGQPKTKINFSFFYQEIAKNAWDHFARELLASGIGRASTPPSEPYQITGGGHYIGTTRMGTLESNSVVDKNCKVHSSSNLYIAGSSVFSAGGAANPTYSIVALSLRLADHLSMKIHKEKF